MLFRFFFFIWVFLIPHAVSAGWTGIAAFVGQHKSDWLVSTTKLNADSRIYGLQIEERTLIGLRIGARASQNSLTLENPLDLTQFEKYNVQSLSFYLRWPFPMTDSLTLYNQFNYQFNLGNQSGVDNTTDTDIDWIETSINIGISLRLGPVSIRPFAVYRSINGEISSPTVVRKIDLKDNQSTGVLLDIHVEPTAYVRLEATTSGSDSLMLSFVREY